MDAIFAILVLGAVIFFGALISAGNERQRKAIDGIREQAAQWAMQDLRLKREHLARDVKVDDPVAWLNRVVAKAIGEDLGLTVAEVYDNPHMLLCETSDGRRVILSPVHPRDIQKIRERNKNKLVRLSSSHPFHRLSANQSIMLSIMNSGVLFDMELEIAWSMMGGKSLVSDCLWLYM